MAQVAISSNIILPSAWAERVLRERQEDAAWAELCSFLSNTANMADAQRWQNAVDTYSDWYKDVHGFRPRTLPYEW